MNTTLLTPVQTARNKARLNRLKQPKVIIPYFIFAFLLVLPLFQPSYFVVDLVVKVLIFGILAASFDVLLGYTGIISFAHSMFFGFGAYSVALLFKFYPDSPIFAIGAAFVVTAILSGIVAALMAIFSLRIRDIFFAMITLAFASFSEILLQHVSRIIAQRGGATHVCV